MINPEGIDMIVKQYRETIGALDSMFSAARLRTGWEVWRFDGVGSCKRVNRSFSETGLVGEARETIIYLRDQRNLDYGGISTVSPCPYHRAEHGCVLGDLKSPLCIAHFDADWEWKSNFGVDTRALKPEIELVLQSILNANVLDDTSVVETFIAKITLITGQISQHPILDEIPRYLIPKM